MNPHQVDTGSSTGTSRADDADWSARSDRRPPLSVTDVSVRFGGVQALEDVSLVLDSARTVAVVGPNGAGKTTLLNAICGMAPLARGRITFDGVETARRGAASVARHGVGRSFQNPQLIEHRSVVENVMCGSHTSIGYSVWEQVVRPLRVRRLERTASSRALEKLAMLGLDDKADTLVSELPYGGRKLVDIARAALAARTLLVLDEPSSGLDGNEQLRLQEALSALNKDAGLAILLVEHHMDLVEAISDRMVCLSSGRVYLAGPTAEVLRSSEFVKLLRGEVGRSSATEGNGGG